MRIAILGAFVVATIAIADAVRAQQAEDIVVANKIVARVRDKGDQPNVFARAAKVHQRITECISKKEAGTAKMSLKKEDERWCIYGGTTMLIRVWPEDAKANNVSDLQLAQQWLKNFERELPNAEPMLFRIARMGDAAFDGPIKRTNDEPGEAASNPSGGNPTESDADGSEESTASDKPPMITQLPKRSTSLLVVLDSFDIVRTYSKEEYEAKRDVLGQRLIERLTPFIRGTVKIEEPVTSPATTRVEPKLSPGAAAPLPVPETPPTPRAPGAPTPPEKTAEPPPAAAAPAAPPTPAAAAGVPDPYAKVPQKERIRRKMNAAHEPLKQMKDRGDERAERAEKLMSLARSKYYSGEFGASEEAADAALRILGLEVK